MNISELLMDVETFRLVIRVLQSTMALLIVLDPLGLMPLVITITSRMSDSERRNVVRRSVLTGFVLLMIFTFAGSWILLFFRITVDDLRIAGGLLLLVIALSIVLYGHMTTEPTTESGTGVVPLASPLLVGPGSITTAVVLVGTVGMFATALSVVLAFAVTWLTFQFTTVIYRIIGESGSDIIARIMGILLAAIAIVYVREGVVGVVRALG
jgi:multiple antibiotic resistance protein